MHNLRRQRIAHGNAKRKQVAITIDDGPHPDFTPRLLETLARYHVRATFFVVGRMAARYPQLIRAIVAEGHCLGNHTYSHADLHALRDDQVDAEITRCAAVLRDITGQCIHLFRPPYGHYSERTLDRSVALGYTMVLWSVHSRDIGGLSARQIEQGVMRRVKPGSIVLFHDGAPQTLQALPRILARLADRGYQFLTADEMLAQGDNGRSSKSGRRPQSVRGRILSDQS